jgi:hypothetical protein
MKPIYLSVLYFSVMAGATLLTPNAAAQSPITIYSAWHCTADYCTWATDEDSTTFDTQNHWMIDRNMDNTYLPAVNNVTFSFVQPVKLMNSTTDSGDANGIPIGMSTTAVSYFENRGVRVQFSIGGQTYTSDWDTALATNPAALGTNAANEAKLFNVGMEIDYENNKNPNLSGLQSFVSAYRAVLPYDATGNNQPARLIIDLGQGDTYLSAIANYASTNWLTTSNPVLDYANAMVSSQNETLANMEKYWIQHVNGYNGVPPVAPAKLTVSLWLTGSDAQCNNWASSNQNAASSWVQNVKPAGAGTTIGLEGYTFWAAGCQGTSTKCTFPPNTCQNGMGVAATKFNIPVPMPALRQQ